MSALRWVVYTFFNVDYIGKASDTRRYQTAGLEPVHLLMGLVLQPLDKALHLYTRHLTLQSHDEARAHKLFTLMQTLHFD